MQDQSCIGGHDFRDQNDTKKLHQTRFPGASTKGLNPSIVLGKAYAARTNERHNMRMQREGVPGGGAPQAISEPDMGEKSRTVFKNSGSQGQKETVQGRNAALFRIQIPGRGLWVAKKGGISSFPPSKHDRVFMHRHCLCCTWSQTT